MVCSVSGGNTSDLLLVVKIADLSVAKCMGCSVLNCCVIFADCLIVCCCVVVVVEGVPQVTGGPCPLRLSYLKQFVTFLLI